MEFTETPLQDAVDYLKDFHGIDIQFDNKALEEIGTSSDSPVSRTIHNMPLGTALKLLLADLDLAHVIRDGVLLITSKDAAERMVELRVYEIDKTLAPEVEADQAGEIAALLRAILPDAQTAPAACPIAADTKAAADPLAKAACQAPAAEARVRIVPYRNLLLIRAPIADHEQIAELLAEIRAKVK
jgi:hypothetical protein